LHVTKTRTAGINHAAGEQRYGAFRRRQTRLAVGGDTGRLVIDPWLGLLAVDEEEVAVHI